MNKNFHEWYLEVCPNPNEGQTEKRIACMENFAKTATVEDIKFLLKQVHLKLLVYLYILICLLYPEFFRGLKSNS